MMCVCTRGECQVGSFVLELWSPLGNLGSVAAERVRSEENFNLAPVNTGRCRNGSGERQSRSVRELGTRTSERHLPPLDLLVGWVTV
jgi:hypothetical protein